MKLAINLTREFVGGITSSNTNLINYLYGQNYEFLGLELNARIHMKAPNNFRNFSPEVFDHHIINIHDLPIMDILDKNKNLSDIKRAYREPISLIRDILKKEKPDVILLSGTYYIPWLISIAASQEKIPIVLWYSGILAKEAEHYLKKRRTFFYLMEREIIKKSSRIIFPSKLCKDVVEQVVTKKKIEKGYIIPNPVSDIFTNPCAVEYSIERRIAAVGRYSVIKNFDKFFELHKELLKNKWRHSATFVTNQYPKIKKLPKSIEVLPPMNIEGIKNFYISQGLIVCPSKFETFGNVPMEAVCLGIPVLVSDKMGCAEILKEVGLENMVISFDNMNNVVERVQSLCGQSILPKQLNALKKLLDVRFISEKIRAVLLDVIK
ncbi:MAG: glycosyltransferase family 4 protein [Patescibacteria group bacterium]|jgi:glycosyltransferase involved in cell wall biosynthesis